MCTCAFTFEATLELLAYIISIAAVQLPIVADDISGQCIGCVVVGKILCRIIYAYS